jgi:Do/DeqQ family serine protease
MKKDVAVLGGALLGGMVLAGATVPGGAAVTAAPAVRTATAAVPAEGGYADVVAKVTPAVVTVRSLGTVRAAADQGPLDPFEEFFGQRRRPERRGGGLGSGVVVSGDGYVLTNHHVVDNARSVEVELADGRVFKARVVGTDPPSDLAVLKLDARGLATLPLGDSDQVRVGDVALAIGNPLGIGQTVTMGIVSAKSRATGLGQGSFEDFIQTDAPINRGNSGGALVNTRGELIGINSQILSPSGGSIGIGFAIPSNMAREVMSQLMSGGAVHRGMMGVTVQSISSDIAASLGLQQVKGALVSSIQRGSPAERAGLRRGDVITHINGQAVSDSNAVRNQIARLRPGTTASVAILRGGRPQTLAVRLAELPQAADGRPAAAPAAPSEGALGLSVAPVNARTAQALGLDGGLQVTDVDPAGPAAEAGIREGDVVEQVNGRGVRSAADLRAAVNASRGRPALLLVRRGEDSLFVAVG